MLERELAHELDLLVAVAWEAVDRDDGVEAELADDPEVAREVGCALLDRIGAALRILRVVLQRLHGGDEDDRARPQVADAADDVHELLHAHVRAEAGLGHDEVAQLERNPVGDERIVAVGDVGEGAAVDERGLALQRLDEVRLDRLLEEHGHRAGGPELLGGDGLALEGRADGDPAEPVAEVVEVARDGHDRHHLGRGGDVEAGLPHVAVRAPAEPDRDVAQRAVVHVDAATPGNGERIDPEWVPV